MKTKRRHDLQTNELADWLGNHIEAVKPYAQYIVAGVIVVAAIVGFVIYQTASNKEQKAQAWRGYVSAMSKRNTSELESVAKSYPKSAAALWALQAAGDLYLDEVTTTEGGAQGSSVPQIYSDRETAIEALEKAKAHFQAVLNGANLQDDLLKQRSELSLAQTYELLSELEQAREHYSNVAKAAPDSAIGRLAAHNAQRLDDPLIQDIYQELSGEIIDPAVEFPDLPQRPDLSFPDTGPVVELSGEGQPVTANEEPDKKEKSLKDSGDDQPTPDDGASTEPDGQDKSSTDVTPSDANKEPSQP